MNEESALQLDPAFQAAQDEFSCLREELAHLLTQEYELLHLIKPNLLALYQQKIGAWEIRCLQAQISAGWTRRRLEMARACIQRGQVPDWAEIDHHLELEFLAWQQRLREAVETLCAAEQRMAQLLTPADNREIRKLYYALVKRLHPDLHPESDENRRRLWLQVQDAYQSGDLEQMRALSLLGEQTVATEDGGSLEALHRQGKTLRRQVAALHERIDRIEDRAPFPLRKQLADEEWVAARRAEIEARTAQWEAQDVACAKAIEVLTTSSIHGQSFGAN